MSWHAAKSIKMLNCQMHMIYFKCVKVKLKLYLFIRASHRRQELSWTPHLLALIPSIVPMPLIKQIFQKIFILWSGGANVDTCIMWALQRSTGEADGDICRCDLSAAMREWPPRPWPRSSAAESLHATADCRPGLQGHTPAITIRSGLWRSEEIKCEVEPERK